jgi:hypothetical protein
MKMDFDSILYIAVTIVILVISALGSRRKKRAQQVQGPAASQGSGAEQGPATDGDDQIYVTEEDEPAPARQEPVWEQAINPLGRLEKILSGQFPGIESMEGESMEVRVDEEEQILEDIRRRRMEKEEEPAPSLEEIEAADTESGSQSLESLKTIKLEKGDVLELFRDPEDIKKAIIYNEILKRKDW